jgi:hypothetical protein
VTNVYLRIKGVRKDVAFQLLHHGMRKESIDIAIEGWRSGNQRLLVLSEDSGLLRRLWVVGRLA